MMEYVVVTNARSLTLSNFQIDCAALPGYGVYTLLFFYFQTIVIPLNLPLLFLTR